LNESENNIEIELINGNENYARKMDPFLLRELSENGQRPRAVVIACSDSRVPVEIIFNISTPGTLFVIRVAGNIISGPIVEGSIEFAVRQFKVPYIVLLGHTVCGAIKARIDQELCGGRLSKMLSSISIASLDMNEAVIDNLDHQFRNLLKVGCVRKAVKNGQLVVNSMIYDLHTGKIAVRNRVGNNPLKQP
jgi:carbonic anhydrase